MIRCSATQNLTAVEVADVKAGKGPGVFPTAAQAVLADATITSWIAPAAGEITAVAAFLGTAVTGDRTTEVDVQIGGATCLTGDILINAAATTTVVQGVLGAGVTFAKGDVIAVINDYTAGTGGGGADLSVSVGYRLT